MLSDKKIKLLEVWKEGIFSEFSIAEIMKISGKKTKTWVFNTLKQLTSEK